MAFPCTSAVVQFRRFKAIPLVLPFLFLPFLLMLSAFVAFAQSTNIAVGDVTLQPSVKRLGVNLSFQDFYDSGQMTKNLLSRNPGFEGQIFQSTVRCSALSTATTCADENVYSGWPSGFWNGASVEVIYGRAQGRKDTVTNYTGPSGGSSGTLTFASSGVAPASGDYVILRKTTPGDAIAGWWPNTSGAGSITTNTTDLPPGTAGLQTIALRAPGAGDWAVLASYFDTSAGRTFVALNGTYQLTFKAKATGGSNSVSLYVQRAGLSPYLNQDLTLSSSWSTYSLTFNATETGAVIGSMAVKFSTKGADSFYLDDVSLTQINSDPANPTAFRDPVVNALKTLGAGELRFWANQLGDTLDNLIAPAFGRQRSGFSAWSTRQEDISYGLPEFLQLCETVGAEPWVVVPITFSTTESANLIEFLSGSTSTTYGAKRAALGHAAPWTSSFGKIHLEFGNEAWNGGFKGGIIEYSAPYGQRAQTVFGAMRASSSYVGSAFDLVLGGQAAWPGRNQDIQNNCNNNDTFAVAPYMMNTVDTYQDNESLYGSSFAEAEAFYASTGTAEGIANGMMLQDLKAIQTSNHPVPLAIYEINLSTVAGAMPQANLNTYAPSLGAGLAVVDSMLQHLRQGIVNQNMFALPQYQFMRSDGKTVPLWGSVIDMGVTDRRRPQFLALQLANQAIGNNSAMLQTVHSGADPTWNQPLVNTVALNNAHHLQSFAFLSGSQRSLVVFNLHRTSSLPVTFTGTKAPFGSVAMSRLTSASLSDTNEDAAKVNITTQTLGNFSAATGLSLPPYSMTVLTWTAGSSPSPVISSVSAVGITTSSATITWNTDQPSSSQAVLNSGAIAVPAVNSSMVTAHAVALTGLTAGSTYTYSVQSTNAQGLLSASPNLTFSTLATPTPTVTGAVISSVATSGIATTSATITWTTDKPSTTQVVYGPTIGYGGSTVLNATLATAHSITLTGLMPGTTYNFMAMSNVATGLPAQSSNFTFKTTTVTIAGGPRLSSVAFWGITGAGATISWATDQLSDTAVEYGTTITNLDQTSPVLSRPLVSHGMTLSGLSSNTTYYFRGRSTNAAGGVGYSTIYSFKTPDTSAPVISNVVAMPGPNHTANMSWSVSKAATTQVEYGPDTSYGRWSLTTAGTQTALGWVPSGIIHYRIRSTDPMGNLSVSGDFTFVEP